MARFTPFTEAMEMRSAWCDTNLSLSVCSSYVHSRFLEARGSKQESQASMVYMREVRGEGLVAANSGASQKEIALRTCRPLAAKTRDLRGKM